MTGLERQTILHMTCSRVIIKTHKPGFSMLTILVFTTVSGNCWNGAVKHGDA